LQKNIYIVQNEGAGRGKARKETSNISVTRPTLNSIDQTESHIIISLNRSSVVIHGCLPSRVGRGRRRGRRRSGSRSRGGISRGGRGRRWGRGMDLGALEAIEGQETE
jgi:hypothetical protein